VRKGRRRINALPLCVHVLRFVPRTRNKTYEHHLHLGVGFEYRSTVTRGRHRVLRFSADTIILRSSKLIRSAPTQYNHEIFVVLGFYAAFTGSLLPTCAYPLKMGPIGCPETSVTDYQSTLRKIPVERSHTCCGGSPKSRHITLATDSAVSNTPKTSSPYGRSTDEEKRR
jgi:hypothetical protein